MRIVRVLTAMLLAACGPEPEARSAPPAGALALATAGTAARGPAAAVQLHGAWRNLGDPPLRGDTLWLRPDSTASGVIPWPPDRYARVAGWSVFYGSSSPVATRADWRHGYSDGGDPACFANHSDSTCISMPHLCLRVGTAQLCAPFVVSNDSLLVAGGLKYARLRIAPFPARNGA